LPDDDCLSLCFDLDFCTEFNNNVLLIANIVKKMTKIVIFNHFGNSIPLYEENLTIIESKTAMLAKIKMKVRDVRLFTAKELIIIFSFTFLIRETIVNSTAKK
jgi:hypothetical protein